MAELASFTLKKRNPDVLTCIANLSNDEVFTPPEFANRMLDTLEKAWAEANNGASIWADSNVKFLDPCTKSGVFLREIVERLTHGLENEIPDLQTRVDHVLTRQVFGIGITHLTSLLARRSVYCSKFANGEHSVASSFDNADGNIWFESIKHTWVGGAQSIETADEQGDPIHKKINGRCKYCGASQSSLERSIESETHAYSFIHTEDVQKFIAEIYGEEMQFDVIIGNPPYQLNDGGGTGSSAMPIYQKFVEQAIALDPNFLTMVTPSRWFTGGRGLDDYRRKMLHDLHIREIHDFPDASDVFPGVEIKGGVSYFLYSRDEAAKCQISTYGRQGLISTSFRPLLEAGFDNFIRNNELVPILHKALAQKEATFDSVVSANDPFGFDVREENSWKRVKPKFASDKKKNDIGIYYFGWRKEGIGYLPKSSITKGQDLIDEYKLFIPKAWGTGNPNSDWLNPFIGDKGTASTETYLAVGPFKSLQEAENAYSYTQTKFFHALVSAVKITQNAMKNVYKCVPLQDFSQSWNDEELFRKYNLDQDEINFIEAMIRPMELENE